MISEMSEESERGAYENLISLACNISEFASHGLNICQKRKSTTLSAETADSQNQVNRCRQVIKNGGNCIYLNVHVHMDLSFSINDIL